jgi:hypothetical protein
MDSTEAEKVGVLLENFMLFQSFGLYCLLEHNTFSNTNMLKLKDSCSCFVHTDNSVVNVAHMPILIHVYKSAG